ncbi:CEP120 isoform 10 [Pan troglodytes]|uniref:Centrosomal protein 120 n=4 Tax=Homininae TaxID=207598 RepID=A0A6Q8PFG1_HUMAN|nr:centrosomal protein 120 [Homo sapiens]KAI4022382.1 centrosomal protein 120 [Homo sapiens]PNI47695.1 CEP120 isoform 10 [Pan troglodytes]
MVSKSDQLLIVVSILEGFLRFQKCSGGNSLYTSCWRTQGTTVLKRVYYTFLKRSAFPQTSKAYACSGSKV